MACDDPGCAGARIVASNFIAKLNYELNKALEERDRMRNRGQPPVADEHIEKARIRHATIRKFLKSEDGKVLMEEMEIQFDGSLVKRTDGGVDIYQTAINVGAREVVHFLRSIRDGKEVVNP